MALSRVWYDTLVDDDGSGTTGTIWNKSAVDSLMDAIDAKIPSNSTFTPIITSTGGGTPTYSIQIGRYSKSDTRMHCDVYVKLATAGTLAAGSLRIEGFPQTVKNVANYFPAVTVSFWENLTTAASALGGFMTPNTTRLALMHIPAAGATTTGSLTLAQASGTFGVILHVSYEIE